jgi:hypothetical protein
MLDFYPDQLKELVLTSTIIIGNTIPTEIGYLTSLSVLILNDIDTL